MHGGRVSLSIGVTATFVALLIGVLYGATRRIFGGRIDRATKVAVTPIESETRPPCMTRMKRSRPFASVPKMCP